MASQENNQPGAAQSLDSNENMVIVSLFRQINDTLNKYQYDPNDLYDWGITLDEIKESHEKDRAKIIELNEKLADEYDLNGFDPWNTLDKSMEEIETQYRKYAEENRTFGRKKDKDKKGREAWFEL